MKIPLEQQEKALLCQLETFRRHEKDLQNYIQRVEAELAVVYAQKRLEVMKRETRNIEQE